MSQRVPPPDWDRYVMPQQQPGPALPPVGDPTRWGAQLDTLIPATGLQQSSQILAASTNDAYSRSWSLIGTLSLHPDLWAAGARIIVSLEITQGVGQTHITQRLCLFDPSVAAGLCYTQYVPNGGPYESIPSASPTTGATLLTRSFAAVGALVGQSINIRARYVVAAVFPALPEISNLALLLTPYAAGEKL